MLKTCEKDLELSEFQGTLTTAEFYHVINDTFELLNSRNLLVKKSTKEAITVQNLANVKEWKNGRIY